MRQHRNGASPELLADHGCAFQRGALRGLEPVESGREQRLDRRRHLHGRRVVLGEHRDHLLDEERVAFGCVRDPSPRVGRERPFRGELVEEELRLGVRQRLERQRDAGPAGPIVEQLVAREAEQQDGRLAAALRLAPGQHDAAGFGFERLVEVDKRRQVRPLFDVRAGIR